MVIIKRGLMQSTQTLILKRIEKVRIMKGKMDMQPIPNNIEQIINEFTTKVKNLLGSHLKEVILYGSYARGDFNENSDIDIMILTDFTDKELEKNYDAIVEIAYDIEFDNNFIIHLSPLVKNIDKFNYWLEVLPFYMNIQKEGIVLNGK